jgi:ABC-2 type transport system ATP-binding protein
MSKDKEIAVKVEGLSKSFVLPHERHRSVKSAFINVFRSKRTFEKQRALQDISFEIKKGEFFGIVGRNGSGKSTLLKLLAGIYSQDKGTITINGSLTPFIELGVGFNPELTGRENVFLNGALLGFNRKQMLEMYDEIVEFAELEKFMDQKLKNYSSGMQVRLAFSIAIRAHTDILLIDEVLAVGDANFQKKCFDIFKQIKNAGRTVIFVTHDMGAVQEFCDRAIMIQDSEVVAIGEPRKIALSYERANSASGEAISGSKTSSLNRPKDPDIQITDVKLKSGSKTAASFSVEEEITAEVKVDVKKLVEFQINLFLLRSNGAYLAGINSYRDLGKGAYSLSKGTHTLTCKIGKGQLPKGEYSVGVGIYTPGYFPDLIDIIDKNYDAVMPQISIINSSTYQDGEFYIEGKWSN